MTTPLDLRRLASHLEALADVYPAKSNPRTRIASLAAAARELDRLRDYRRFMADNLFRMPLGDVETEAEGIAAMVRELLTIALDHRDGMRAELSQRSAA